MNPIGLLSKSRADALYALLVHNHAASAITSGTLDVARIPDLDGAKITSGTVAAARLGVMTGDSGSGGASGAVPAPASGDAVRYLRGDGTWATVSAGMTSFSVAGSTGTPQTIGDGNTLTIAAGAGITTNAAATDTVTVAIDSTVVTLTGTQTLSNKTLTTPTIADLTNAGHSHQNAAGGGTLDAAAIASGTLDNGRVNWAAPAAIGSITPAAGTFTLLQADSSSQHYINSSIAAGSTAAMVVRRGSAGPVLDLRGPSSTYLRMIRDSDNYALGVITISAVAGAANMTVMQGASGVALGTGGTYYFASRPIGTIVSNDIGANAPNAPFHVRFTTTSNSSEHQVTRLSAVGSAAPGAGFGGRVELTLRSSTTAERQAGGVHWAWADSTDATRKGDLFLTAYDASTAIEGVRVRAGSGVAQLGFYGVTPVSRPNVTGSRGGNAALASLLTELANLGLITDGSS